MNQPQSPAWEDWQLTAFVLGELDAATAQRIKLATAKEPRLARQLDELRQTLDQVTHVLQAEALAEAQHLRRAPTVTPPRATLAVSPTSSRRRRLWVLGLLGVAASLMVALYLASPKVTPHQMTLRGESEAVTGLRSVRDKSVAQSQPHSSANMSAHIAPSSGPSTAPAVGNGGMLGSGSPFNSPGPSSGYGGGMMGGYGGGDMYGGGAASPGATADPGAGSGYGGGGYGGAMLGGAAGGMMGGGYGGAGGYGGGGIGMGGYGGGSGYGGEATGGPGTSALPTELYAQGMGGEGGYGGAGYGSGVQSLSKSPFQPQYQTPRIIIQEEEEAKFASGQAPNVGAGMGPEITLGRNFSRHRQLDQSGSQERYGSLSENQFQSVDAEPLSTFSIDVDSASYTKCRQLLLELSRRPPANAVRIEEFINYFDYEYAGPLDDKPFASHLAVTSCPWQPQHKLVRIALQAKKVDLAQRPAANVVFLLDVSGSMNEPNKLPLVKDAMRMLAEQLGEKDKVAMAVYAGAAGCVLEGTRGDQQPQILAAIDRLQAGGSTNGGQGIQLAYQLARDNFIPAGINRVVLCTDGDFNVGVTSTESLVDLVAENAKSNIFLTVLGFGAGNTNDAMMEEISNRGNGVYGFVDSRREAHRQMVRQLAGNLMTVAKDVKIQVEFNPTKVASYRLLGYENRMLATEDFNNDKKDAGEIGAGHRVTALYEIVPVGSARSADHPDVDELRYQTKSQVTPDQGKATDLGDVSNEVVDELLAVKLRYKQPEGETSQLLTFPLTDSPIAFKQADRDLQWAATVAQFGMLLRGSQYAGNSTWSNVLEQAIEVVGVSPDATRQECLEMIRKCQQ